MKWDHTHHDDSGVPKRTPSVTLKHTTTSRYIELGAQDWFGHTRGDARGKEN